MFDKEKMKSIFNYDVWDYILKKLKLSLKNKFDIFLYGTIGISLMLDLYVIKSHLEFFSYAIIFLLSIMLNEKKFLKIQHIVLWEFLLGVMIVISSFTIITPIKHVFAPHTKEFGGLNGVVLLIGILLLFYGIKNYRTVMPFALFIFILYIFMLLVFGTWKYSLGPIAEKYISPITAQLSYGFLKFLGYPVTKNGLSIGIETTAGKSITATVAGPCSGIEGMILSTLLLLGLFIGSNLSYIYRVIIISIGALIMFLINVLRISLIFIIGYYWGNEGFNTAHTWLGEVLFLVYILIYWYIIDWKMKIKYPA